MSKKTMNGEIPDFDPVKAEVGVAEAKQAIMEAKNKAIQQCQAELIALLKKHNCSLASYQELVNGTPKCPAQIMVVHNE